MIYIVCLWSLLNIISFHPQKSPKYTPNVQSQSCHLKTDQLTRKKHQRVQLPTSICSATFVIGLKNRGRFRAVPWFALPVNPKTAAMTVTVQLLFQCFALGNSRILLEFSSHFLLNYTWFSKFVAPIWFAASVQQIQLLTSFELKKNCTHFNTSKTGMQFSPKPAGNSNDLSTHFGEAKVLKQNPPQWPTTTKP